MKLKPNIQPNTPAPPLVDKPIDVSASRVNATTAGPGKSLVSPLGTEGAAPLKIKCLQGAHLAVASNKMLRLLEVVYTIKSIWVKCPMPYTGLESCSSAQQIAAALGISARQVIRNIEPCIQHDLLRVTLNGIEAISYAELAHRLGLEICNKDGIIIPIIDYYYINYTPNLGEKGRKLRLWHILYTKVKLEKKKQCAHAVKQRIKHNNLVKEVLEEVAGTEYIERKLRRKDPEEIAKAVETHQLQNFITEGATYDDAARYVLSLHFTNRNEKKLRGDLEMNKQTWRKVHGYTRTGSVIYMDRQCQKLGLLTNTPRKTPIPGHHTRGSRRHNFNGFIKYEPAEGQLYLIQCNAVQILPINGIQTRLQANIQAAKQTAEMLAAMQPAPKGKHHYWVKKAWVTRKAKAQIKQQANETVTT